MLACYHVLGITLSLRHTHTHTHTHAHAHTHVRAPSCLLDVLFVVYTPRRWFTVCFWQLAAPLLYVFANERDAVFEEAEADAFFCFANLMGEVCGSHHLWGQ